MTDQGWRDMRDSEEGTVSGEKCVQVQSYPFRMTRMKMSGNRQNPNIGFWRNLKQGYDAFETTRRDPGVSACEARYASGLSNRVEDVRREDALLKDFNDQLSISRPEAALSDPFVR